MGWPVDGEGWKYGGGPTWRSGSYDPELDLVYWGTGNAEPYDKDPHMSHGDGIRKLSGWLDKTLSGGKE